MAAHVGKRREVISKKLQELYKRYSSPNEHLVPCGVVNQEAYGSSSPKLVCVLREPNDPEQTPGWTIVRFLQKQVEGGLRGQSIYPMWKVVGIWSYAIRNGFPRYGDINTVQISAEGLKYIGMTNLKKSGGGGTANYRAIREYAKKTTELWKSELEIMDPDIILCCGTFWIVTELLGLGIGQTAAGLPYSVWERDSGDSLLLSIYHPASRFRKAMLYAFLKEALVELHEKGFWHGCDHHATS